MKGQSIAALPVAVGIIIVVALFATIGVLVLGEIADSEIDSVSIGNESVNITTVGSAVTVAGAADGEFINVSVLPDNFYNGTDNVTRLDCMTFDTETGTITTLLACEYNNSLTNDTNIGFDYTWRQGSDARDATNDGITGVAEVSDWLDVIAIVVAAATIIALVVGVLRAILR